MKTMSKYVQYFIVLLLLPSFINGDRNDWFQMDTPYGSLTFNEKGWARPVNGENEKPVLFEEFVDTNGKIYIQVMSGNYAGYYLSGDVKEGVGAYKKWDDASYFKWNGCHLENLSLRVAGLQLVYGSNGYFYFYTVAPQYPLMCITKKYPNRVSENKCQPTSVEGMWKYMFTIPGKTSRQLKIGATKTHKESTTSEWSQGVSITSKNSLTIKGVFETGVDLTADIRKTLANTHETELSTNTEETWTVEFGENDRGKALWQFIFNIKDTCDHNEQIFVKEYAITQKKRNPPCCLPGYSSDGLNYGVCDSADALIEKSDKHCTVSISRRSLIPYT